MKNEQSIKDLVNIQMTEFNLSLMEVGSVEAWECLSLSKNELENVVENLHFFISELRSL